MGAFTLRPKRSFLLCHVQNLPVRKVPHSMGCYNKVCYRVAIADLD